MKKNSDDMKYVNYKCACGATDANKYFPSEVQMPVVNCHKCGAGRGMTINEQITNRAGMFPVRSAA